MSKTLYDIQETSPAWKAKLNKDQPEPQKECPTCSTLQDQIDELKQSKRIIIGNGTAMIATGRLEEHTIDTFVIIETGHPEHNVGDAMPDETNRQIIPNVNNIQLQFTNPRSIQVLIDALNHIKSHMFFSGTTLCKQCRGPFRAIMDTDICCSPNCYDKYLSKHRKLKKFADVPKDRPCKQCRTLFAVGRSDKLYCSNKCKAKFNREKHRPTPSIHNPPPKRIRPIQPCPVCHTPHINFLDKRRTYCSAPCKIKGFELLHEQGLENQRIAATVKNSPTSRRETK
jgi:hypothetical protein